MTLKALMDIITIIAILIFGTVTLVFIRRNKLKPESWPGFIGISGGICLFVLLMIQSIFMEPSSELFNYTVTNSVLSLALGIMAYFSFRQIKIARDNVTSEIESDGFLPSNDCLTSPGFPST